MGLTKKTLNAGGWKFAGVVTKALTQIVVLAVLARYILAEEFGLVAIGTIIIAFGTMFSQIGLGPALIQRKNISSVHIRVGFTTSVILALIVWGLLWLSSPLIAIFFREPLVTPIIRALGLSFLFSSFGLVSKSLLARDLEFKKLTIAELISHLVGYAGVGITLAVNGFGVWALVGATVSQRALESVSYFLFRPHSLFPSLARREISDLMAFGSGLALSQFFHLAGNHGDNAVIGRLLGASALGIYGRAFQLMSVPIQYLGDVIDSVMFPAMSRIQEETTRLGNVFLRAVSVTNLILLPASVLGIILAPEIVNVVLGEKWAAAVVPLQLLTAAASFKGSVRMCDSLARALGAVYRSAARKAIYAIGIVGGSWIGHFYGLNGVAWGVSGAVFLIYLLMLHLSLSLVDRRWRDLLAALVPGGILSIIVILLLWPLTTLLRNSVGSDLVVLLVASGTVAATVVTLALTYPPVLGRAGLWLVGHLLERVPSRNILLLKLRASTQRL